MANETMTLFSTLSLGGTTSGTWSSIPQTATDIVVVYSTRDGDTGGSATYLSFNGVTTDRTMRYVRGNYGVSATPIVSTSSTAIFGRGDSNDRTSNTFASGRFYIPDYTSSTIPKTVIGDSGEENNSNDAYTMVAHGLWNNTAAITSVTITAGSGNFISGSTASLYLVKKGSGGANIPTAKATGGTIVYNGGYWYHTFTSSGTFTPTVALTADVLVVAGGGGGGARTSFGTGGGGAGGLVYASSQSLTTSAYTVTVGSGGAGSPGGDAIASSGNSTTFTGLTSAIGGGYGGTSTTAGGSGGSGGGAGGINNNNGGSGTSGQGNNGGGGNNADYANGGGGGGAGAAGETAVLNSRAGKGGNGVNTYSVWATATNTGASGYYAGGGAGSGQIGAAQSGGLGGGGSAQGGNGTNYTGGGGAANSSSGGVGGNGGSGVVIVRYVA